MNKLITLALIIGSFVSGARYQRAHQEPAADTKALQGCELIASQTLHQAMEAEYEAQECKASQIAFLDALNKLGDELETTE